MYTTILINNWILINYILAEIVQSQGPTKNC